MFNLSVFHTPPMNPLSSKIFLGPCLSNVAFTGLILSFLERRGVKT